MELARNKVISWLEITWSWLDTQQTDLQDYQLARNKVTRYIKSHVRYNYADLITFTLMSVDDIIVKEYKN